jgi:L-alanine-DL-glutamate epimerase-like enolase superfamily enzyme
VVTTPFGLDADGMIAIPQAHGLGIHVLPEAVAQYREALVELAK